MELDQAEVDGPAKSSKTQLSAKKAKGVASQTSRLSSELETLRAVSKRTFASGDRMAVHRFVGAVFNQVSRWEAEDRLEEGLYRLLDSLKAPVPLRIGEAFAVVIYCIAPHIDKKSRSKWARALRYAAANKPNDEPIRKFFKRKAVLMRVLPGMPICSVPWLRSSCVLQLITAGPGLAPGAIQQPPA